MSVTLLTPPVAEPLSLAEAKAWLRIDTTDEDALICALIAAARAGVEQAAGRCLISQTWRVKLDDWPSHGVIRLPLAPVQALLGVRVLDAQGAPETLSLEGFQLDAERAPALLHVNGPMPLPGQATSGIEIDLTCGYGPDADDVPEPLRLAVRLLVARWYEHRGDTVTGDGALPRDIAMLVAPFRTPRL